MTRFLRLSAGALSFLLAFALYFAVLFALLHSGAGQLAMWSWLVVGGASLVALAEYLSKRFEREVGS